MKFTLDSDRISLNFIFDLLRKPSVEIELSEKTQTNIENCRKFLLEKISDSEKPIYGINTGFGSLCDTIIPRGEIQELQANLVKSHACGMGDVVPQHICRLMLLLKIINLSHGKSGVSLELMERLIFMYNHEITPIIYEQGSLGASGDLAPLAHLSLPIIGEGEVWMNGKRIDTEKAFKEIGLKPLVLGPKEGLALLNGTQFMLAYAIDILFNLKKTEDHLFPIMAASIDAFNCLTDPYESMIHNVRSHKGQVNVAEKIVNLIRGSQISSEAKEQVQDPYSFRCIPQVLGASFDTIEFVSRTIETELQSVTDNPLVFPEEDRVISGGNFHGQPLALSLDYLCIAISEMASISERRTYKMLSGKRGLPEFLTPNPGLNSGFMIVQYTAASMVSQNKQLCTPSSVDTIDSSNGQEDHVSMGANAALSCHSIMNNYLSVLGIELLTASQALYFRQPLKSSKKVEEYIFRFRKVVGFIERDTVMYPLMNKAMAFIRETQISGS